MGWGKGGQGEGVGRARETRGERIGGKGEGKKEGSKVYFTPYPLSNSKEKNTYRRGAPEGSPMSVASEAVFTTARGPLCDHAVQDGNRQADGEEHR